MITNSTQSSAVNTALDVAKYVAHKCIEAKRPVNNIQLQNILYLIQRDCLKRNTIAFNDSFIAWPTGPTIPIVFWYFRQEQKAPITDCIKPACEYPQYNHIIYEGCLYDANAWAEKIMFPGGAYDFTFNGGEGKDAIISVDFIKGE